MRVNYIAVDWDRPHGHERLPEKPIKMTKEEACKLNKQLLLNNEKKRYVRLELMEHEK